MGFDAPWRVIHDAEWVYARPLASRRSWVWATPFLLAAGVEATLFLADLLWPVLPFWRWGADGMLVEPWIQMPWMILLAGLAVAVFVVWARWFERRGFASLGLVDPLWGKRLLWGLAAGCMLVILIDGLGGLLTLLTGGLDGETDGWFWVWRLRILAGLGLSDWARLLAFGCGVALYACAEEVVFRGWLLSAIAARWGVGPAVLLTSALFAAVHAHLFGAGLLFGSFSMIALALTGIAFSLLALSQKSLFGAMGLHVGFNVVMIGGAALDNLNTEPALSMNAALAQALDIAALWADGQVLIPSWYDLAAATVFAALSLLLIDVLRKQRRHFA